MRTEIFETVLLKVFLILTSELCMPPVNSGQSHHDLSRSAPPDISPGPFLPPAQLDLELSHHHPGQTLLSRGCPDTELLIRCPPDQMLLVHSARFIPAMWAGAEGSGTQHCSSLTKHSQTLEGEVIRYSSEGRDIRQALNRRCSGYSSGEECKFSLLLDQPESRSWGEGWVEVWHKCVPQGNITTKCGKVKQLQRGYIMSKAYPKYYMGGESCTWHISVPPSQVLLLIVLDLQLRGLSNKGECDDSLTIDYQAVLCGELDKQLHYISNNGRAVVKFKTASYSQYIHPQRGFIIEIVPVGCSPVPPSPQSNAYLVSHNQTHAAYRCREGYVFQTTLSPTTTLFCTGHTYHAALPACVPAQLLLTHSNSSMSVVHALHNKEPARNQSLPTLWLEEVFLPLVLTITTLVLSLAGLILIILMRNHFYNTWQEQEQVGLKYGLRAKLNNQKVSIKNFAFLRLSNEN